LFGGNGQGWAGLGGAWLGWARRGWARRGKVFKPKEEGMGKDKKTIREASVETRLIYQRLSGMNIGDFVSYSDLNELVGRNVQKEGRGYLNTARLMCERDDDKAFGVVLNEGLKCLNSKEIINTAEFSIGHIKRTSRKSLKKVRCINDLEQLPNDEKIRLNTYASILGVMATMAKGSNIRKIEARVQETQEQLPYVKTLEAFAV
jgi:hypothetical protein